MRVDPFTKGRDSEDGVVQEKPRHEPPVREQTEQY